MEKMRLTAVSTLKKYSKLNGYSALSYSPTSFLKHLAIKFKFSEFEIRKAHRLGKIRLNLL